MIYVIVNNILTLLVAIPAAYAFSRYSFLVQTCLLLVSRQPNDTAYGRRDSSSAIFSLRNRRLCLAVALAHCLFTVPIAV